MLGGVRGDILKRSFSDILKITLIYFPCGTPLTPLQDCEYNEITNIWDLEPIFCDFVMKKEAWTKSIPK